MIDFGIRCVEGFGCILPTFFYNWNWFLVTIFILIGLIYLYKHLSQKGTKTQEVKNE